MGCFALLCHDFKVDIHDIPVSYGAPFLCKSGVFLMGFNTCIITLVELVALRCVLRT